MSPTAQTTSDSACDNCMLRKGLRTGRVLRLPSLTACPTRSAKRTQTSSPALSNQPRWAFGPREVPRLSRGPDAS